MARSLIRAYASHLSFDLAYQHIDEELAHVASMYGPPGGAFFIANVEDKPVGCVGVRRSSAEVAELKRLYVVPGRRGLRIGQRLLERAIEFARGAGYRTIRLDTTPEMQTAQSMYEKAGFVDCAAFAPSPISGTRYMELQLNHAI